jgi:hypothetical protein
MEGNSNRRILYKSSFKLRKKNVIFNGYFKGLKLKSMRQNLTHFLLVN